MTTVAAIRIRAEGPFVSTGNGSMLISLMNLIINGAPRTFDAVSNVAELIDKLAIKGDRVAVELNREIVPRAQWPSSALKDGDKLEIVHFVGGGIVLP